MLNENNQKPKRPIGRPRVETYLNPEWYKIIIDSGRAGKSGQSNKFNQRLWLQIVKNKFRDNWKDEKQIDVTTQGDKISDNKSIQIEIIQPKDDGI